MSLGWYIAIILFLGYLAIVASVEVLGGGGAILFWTLCFVWLCLKDMLK